MKDERKTKAQLAEELADLRLQVADLRQREARASDTEEALREHEQSLQAILDGIEDGITARDRDYNILRVNRWIEQMFAHEMPLVGKKCYRAFEQREEPCPWCPAIKAMETGNVFSQVVSVPVASGMTRWFELTAFPFRDAQGAIGGAIEHVKDVTDHKAAEEALRESEARYRAVVETQSEMVVRFLPDYTLTFVNEAYCRFFDAGREELIGVNFLPFIPDEDRHAVTEHFASITPENPVTDDEHRAILPSGEVRWMHWTNRGIFDDQGRLVEFQSSGRDITDRRAAEEALRKASEEKSLILSNVFEEVIYHDRDMGIVWANRAAGESAGLPPEQLVGRMCYKVWHGREQVCDGCPIRKALDTGSPAETEITTPDGRAWHVHGHPVFEDGGKVIGAVEVVRDITGRKAAEEALRRSEANYRAIFNAAGDVLFVHDIETGDVVDFNQKGVEVYGYDLKEIDLLNEQFRRGADTPYSYEDQMRWLRRAADQGPQLFEWLATDRSGRRFWVEVSLRRAAIGGHDRLLAVLRDIEDRKRAEEALRRSEENYRALFEQSVDGIVVVADTRIVRANQAFADIHGWPVEELIGMTSTDLLHPDERAAAAERIRGVIDRTSERSNARQYHALRADGSIALVEYRSRRILWEGKPAIQAIVRDITEQVRLEEELRQAQKMEAVGQLAGGIAHDFNNLMTGILCHADLLKSEAQSPEDVREAAGLIEGAARRAAELTGQLLGFARRGKRRDIPVDLNATARTSVRLLGRSLDPRIRVTMPFRDEHAFVRGDPLQIEQVVLNLAMNARDAMPEGGEMTFTIQTLDVDAEDCKSRPGAEPGRYVVLSVADTGCGIPEAMRGRVFEPFFTTKPHGKGTGMGLAMVYGIVKDHGGWVEVDSEPGRGTTFRVFLPATEAPADAGATPADIDLRAPPDAGRILVVDDEELVRNVVVRMLSGLGYEVATAANAREAVEYYKRFGRDVSVVIIDMAMPKMDGRRCFAALRDLDPDVKALLATGCGNEDRVQDALDEGMAGLVRKPFQREQLAEAVKRTLTQ